MAVRAAQTFVTAAGLKSGSRQYDKDSVVPAEVAKALKDSGLVYDDAPPAPARKRAAAKADDSGE